MKIKPLNRFFTAASFIAFTMASASATAEVIDVLVLYTPEALQTRNGADIDARIATYISYANEAYENSEVDMQLRLAGSALLDSSYQYVTDSNLTRLRKDSVVANLRREHGADVVVLLTLRQKVSDGYVCGIGYIPSGDGNSGQLYSNASSRAYSLVGIDCGINTFAHEVGHNMSLGHSHAQGSTGGVWPWARGHGEQGVFSTIMAYPGVYGVGQRLPVFSNPRIDFCEGLACGVDKAQRDGADAAANLTALASQIADFMPTVDAVDDPEENEPPSDVPCEKEPVAGNLLDNGEFDSLEGWQSGFGTASLSIATLQTSQCLDNALIVGDRTQYYSSAYQDTRGKLTAGEDYRFSGRFGIANGSREKIGIALRVRDSNGSHYTYLEPISVTASELTPYHQDFSIESGDVEGVLIYGPPAGVDIVMDSLSIVPANGAPDQASESAYVINEQFELSANGWQPYYGGKLSYIADASTGKYSLRASRRASVHSGPAFDASGALRAGETYRLSASVKVTGGAADQNVQAWLYFEDNSGGHWQKLAGVSASVGTWALLDGEFSLDTDGEISQTRLHFMGPEVEYMLQLDNLAVGRL